MSIERILLVKYMRLVMDATGSDHLMSARPPMFTLEEIAELEECSNDAYVLENAD